MIGISVTGKRNFVGASADIMTDMDPDTLSEVGAKMAQRWIDFAMGRKALGGRMLMHPTGRYASAISFRTYGVSRVAIVVNENVAPEAHFLEVGHGPIDLKKYFAMGTLIPMHRGEAGQYGSAGYSSPIEDHSRNQRRRKNQIWGVVREQGKSGRAVMSMTSSTGKNWVIPPMAAFSPVAHLLELLRQGEFGAIK